MFTGIIEATSAVQARSESGLTLAMPSSWRFEPLVVGESIAVCGCCLTLVEGDQIEFNVSQETLNRTTLGTWEPGKVVNLERSMKLGDRLGGHIVQGHVDTTGEVLHTNENSRGWEFAFQISREWDRYLIDKGSIAVDGVSLTLVNPMDGQFGVAIIPHTFAHTNLRSLRPGDRVNIEFDVLAKHIEKLLSARN